MVRNINEFGSFQKALLTAFLVLKDFSKEEIPK
jgi:hypothetical protein